MNINVDLQMPSANTKSATGMIRPGIILLCLLWTFGASVRADVVYHAVNYPPNVVGGWSSIDFDGDGTADVAFELVALSFDTGGVMFLKACGLESTELIMENGIVLPLASGMAISPLTTSGLWQATGYDSLVWRWTYSAPLGDTNIIGIGGGPPVGDPPQQPPPGRGVGMPGFGEYMGVRFRIRGEWHYAWVRFGLLQDTSWPLPQPGWPSVLEYAYERRPAVQILAGSKPVAMLLAPPEVVRPGQLRLKWAAQVGTTYQVQAKKALDAFAWTNLSFSVPATATNIMVDLPMESSPQFFRVIEAD